MKRLGLFVFYDKDGIVDDYVVYMIRDLMENLNHISIISNSKILDKELQKFHEFTKDITIRENKGLDAGALYEYFTTRDDYKEYDEIVILNDTFYGPLYPFKEVFDNMDKKKNLDFWGMTKGYKQIDGWNEYEDGILPEHLQTFFLVLRNKVFTSNAFEKYWKQYDIKHMNTFDEVVSKHETRFTKYLYDNGFEYDSYVQDSNVDDNPIRNYNNYAYDSSTQIINNRAPFLKRKNLVYGYKDMLYYVDNDDLKKSMEHIKNNTNYDVGMIWKNVLRLYDLDLIKNTYGFYEVVKESNNKIKSTTTAFIKVDNKYNLNILEEKVKYFDKYYLYTSLDEVYNYFNKKKIEITKINKNFQEVFVKDLDKLDTDYFVFFNFVDDVNAVNLVNITINDVTIKNLIKDEKYFSGLLNKLDNNKNIGMAYGPDVINFNNFSKNNNWDNDVIKAIKKIMPDYKKKINFKKLPVSFSNSFVCKKSVLKTLNLESWQKFENETFIKTFSILLSYYGTYQSMYPIIVMNENYALYKLNLMTSMNRETYKNLYKLLSLPADYSGSLNLLNNMGVKNLIKLTIRKILSKCKRLCLKLFYYPIKDKFKKNDDE